jgi:ribonuclease Z
VAIEISILGTSAAVPTSRRNLSALALRGENDRGWILFDCGEATQHRLRENGISPCKIEKIFITHLHGDHIYGIFGLLAAKGMNGCPGKVQIYSPEGGREMIECVMRLSSLHLPFDIEFTTIRGEKRYDFGDYSIESVPLSHSIECYGYVYIQSHRPGKLDVDRLKRAGVRPGPLYGKLKDGMDITLENGLILHSKDFVGEPSRGKTIIIGGDNDSPELFSRYTGADMMIHEATYTKKDFEKLEKRYRHSTAEKVALTASEMGVKKLVLTHISPRYDTPEREKELIDEASIHYHGELILARDSMKLHI